MLGEVNSTPRPLPSHFQYHLNLTSHNNSTSKLNEFTRKRAARGQGLRLEARLGYIAGDKTML